MIRANIITKGLGASQNILRRGFARPFVGSSSLTLPHPYIGSSGNGLLPVYRATLSAVVSHQILSFGGEVVPDYFGSSLLVMRPNFSGMSASIVPAYVGQLGVTVIATLDSIARIQNPFFAGLADNLTLSPINFSSLGISSVPIYSGSAGMAISHPLIQTTTTNFYEIIVFPFVNYVSKSRKVESFLVNTWDDVRYWTNGLGHENYIVLRRAVTNYLNRGPENGI